MARKIKKALWERGYKSHCLWRGKEKLAKVRLEAQGDLKYIWEAAGRTGETGTLSAAKAAWARQKKQKLNGKPLSLNGKSLNGKSLNGHSGKSASKMVAVKSGILSKPRQADENRASA